MKTKILLVNLQNPDETCYRNDPESVALYLMGRRVANYMPILIQEHRKHIIALGNTTACNVIQQVIQDELKYFNQSCVESAY